MKIVVTRTKVGGEYEIEETGPDEYTSLENSWLVGDVVVAIWSIHSRYQRTKKAKKVKRGGVVRNPRHS